MTWDVLVYLGLLMYHGIIINLGCALGGANDVCFYCIMIYCKCILKLLYNVCEMHFMGM